MVNIFMYVYMYYCNLMAGLEGRGKWDLSPWAKLDNTQIPVKISTQILNTKRNAPAAERMIQNGSNRVETKRITSSDDTQYDTHSILIRLWMSRE